MVGYRSLKCRCPHRQLPEVSVAPRNAGHTFGSHLSKNDVPLCAAQAAMRQSSLHLTMNVYTDPSLLDGAGGLEVLPTLNAWAG